MGEHMAITNPHSSAFSDTVQQALRGYQRLHVGQVTFGNVPPFVDTPQKPYTAKTITAVRYRGQQVGDMHIIVFSPDDGTGDANTYGLDSLVIPSDLRFAENPERVIPRSKAGMVCEGFFPMFSIRENGTSAMFSNALEMLTVDDAANPKSVARGWRLGLSDIEYAQALAGRVTAARVYCTTWHDRRGKRFGDPHAIHYDPNIGGVMQVAGFLALQGGNPLLNLARGWSTPKEYQKG